MFSTLLALALRTWMLSSRMLAHYRYSYQWSELEHTFSPSIPFHKQLMEAPGL